jgi:hemolysin activation/secretion protein
VYALAYAAPIGATGDSLSVLAVRNSSNVPTVGTLGVLGKGTVTGIHYAFALPPIGRLHSTFTVAGDYKDFDQSVTLSSSPGLVTPIKYINWSGTFAAVLPTARSTTSFDLGVNFGIEGLANTPTEFENNRYLAQANYMYWRLDASHEQQLWSGSRLAVRLNGQFTTEPLVQYEQIAIGGVYSVRGYLEAEALGDMGGSGSVELRSPNWQAPFGIQARQAYAYVFYDAGIVGIIDPLPEQAAREHLQSWGLGLQLTGYRGFDAGIDWARPLVTTAYTTAGQSRANFHVRYGF